MKGTTARVVLCTALSGGWLALAAGPASADVVSPPGACTGSGHWVKAGISESSTAHQSSDVIKVPRSDDVQWQGSETGGGGGRRAISGAVEVKFPFGGSVTVGSWGGTSTKTSNSGVKHYDLTSVAGGIKLKLYGFHNDAGKRTCEGSVYLEISDGGFKNKASYGALAGMVISGAGLVFAGRR